MMGRLPSLRELAICVAVLLAGYLYMSFHFTSQRAGGALHSKNGKHKACKWEEGDPMVILLKTKMGVTYDGGHWFHMAENFMASFSELRANHHTVNSSVVYFVFDAEYVSQLNAMTKYMLTVAATDGRMKEVHFLYHPESSSSGHEHLDTLSPGSTVLMHKLRKNKTTATHHVVHLDADVPTAERFVKNAAHHHHDSDGRSHCAQYFGSLGGKWPTVQRGHWFPNPGDVDVFRERTAILCPSDPAVMALHRKTTEHKLVLYQRDLSRRVLNDTLVMKELSRSLGPTWTVELLMHKFDRSPCELSHILVDVDVLVTAHGFQSMVMLFLPRPALLYEVFPFRYQKTGYAPLCREYGIFYGASMSPPVSPLWRLLLSVLTTEQCMLNRYCRNFARDDDVLITEHSLTRIRDSIHDYLDSKQSQCLTGSSSSDVSKGSSSLVSTNKEIANTGRTIVTFKEEGDTLVNPVVCEGIYDHNKGKK
jgi:hypothetical protein